MTIAWSTDSDLGLSAFMSIQGRVSLEEEILIEELPPSDWPIGQSVKVFSLLMIGVEGCTMGCSTIWQVILGYIRKEAEKPIDSKPAITTLPWFLL